MANEKSVDVDIYIPFMKSLIKKYGDFKINSEMHNAIITKLAEICEMVGGAVVKQRINKQ